MTAEMFVPRSAWSPLGCVLYAAGMAVKIVMLTALVTTAVYWYLVPTWVKLTTHNSYPPPNVPMRGTDSTSSLMATTLS